MARGLQPQAPHLLVCLPVYPPSSALPPRREAMSRPPDGQKRALLRRAPDPRLFTNDREKLPAALGTGSRTKVAHNPGQSIAAPQPKIESHQGAGL